MIPSFSQLMIPILSSIMYFLPYISLYTYQHHSIYIVHSIIKADYVTHNDDYNATKKVFFNMG